MCGIIGSINFHSSQLIRHRISSKNREKNTTYYSADNSVFFGYTQRAIVDSTCESKQLFYSADKQYILLYNGELYNYKELANKYALPLHTSSDAEVIIELYIQLGKTFLKELNGKFVGVIYNVHTKKLFIFRDRLGIMPLYYWHQNDKFAFASEVSALLGIIDKPDLNQQAVADFLHFGYIPEPLTFYEGVYKFQAGSYGFFHNGKLEIKTYWQAEDCVSHTVSNEKKVIADVEELLRDSVKIRLTEDLSFGTFLSGGTDSGLVSAIAADLSPGNLNVFNVSFEDAVFDEQAYAKKMAEVIEARYHHLFISKRDIEDIWEEGVKLVGEPFGDSSIFPTLLVSKFARSHVEMVLSGDGGDELFMGYGAYTWADRLNNPLINHNRKLIAFLLRLFGGVRRLRAANVFDYHKNNSLYSHIFSQEQNLFSAREVEEIVGLSPTHYSQPLNLNRELTPAEQQALFDMKYYLKDDLLVKVERSAARHGLDVRLPFLDHRLVEYALNIDPALKRKNGEQKYILKKIMERYYPPELIYRKKWGFSIPLEKWMKESSVFSKVQIHPEFKTIYNDLNNRFKKSENHGYLYNRLYLLNILSRFYK